MDVQTDAALEATLPATEKSGYPLQILTTKPDEKLCCSQCKLVLREPMQNKCGHRFCRGCIEPIRKIPTPVICQSCKDEGVEDDDSVLRVDNMFDDKAARREMKKLAVKCIFPNCNWKGFFSNFIEHEENCEKKMVLCAQCNTNVSKAKMSNHLSKHCIKRQVPCQNCEEMIVYDNIENHHKICPEYVIKCEGCATKVTRKELADHLERTCNNRIISCPVPACNLRLPMNQFLHHLGKEPVKVDHLAFLLESVHQINEKMEVLKQTYEQPRSGAVVTASVSVAEAAASDVPDITETSHETERSAGDGAQADAGFQSEDRQKLKLHEDLMSVLHSEILRCIDKLEAFGRGMEKEEKRVRDLYTQFDNFRAMFHELDRKFAEISQHIPITSKFGELSSEGNGMFLWQIPSFTEIRRNACNNLQESLSSQCFFSEPSGYNMKLTFYPDGRGSSKTKYFSIFLEIVSGPYDDLLLWPFSGKIHFILIDQKNFQNHFIKTCQTPDRLPSIVQRPTAAESRSFGIEDFIQKEHFAKNLNTFIVGDKIYFKVYVEPSAEAKERIALLTPRRILERRN